MLSPDLVETIAAVATPSGRGGVGIIRISGGDLKEMARALIGDVPSARRAIYCDFLSSDRQAIDSGLALYFAAPASYTGEDVLELQGHGSPVLLQMLLRRCIELGARLAEPGEFTKRAFLNGKLDLAQAEAVAGIIEAQSEAAARCAVRSLKGEFSEAVHLLEQRLRALRIHVEALLDFPEEDIGSEDGSKIRVELAGIVADLEVIREKSRQGGMLLSGVEVVLAGLPNAGKSSLMNRLAGEDVSIVTSVPGTTRDSIRRSILVDGMPVNVVDTAGLRETLDEIELLGVERSWSAIRRADLVLHVVDAKTGWTPADDAILGQFPRTTHRLTIFNKADLLAQNDQEHQLPADDAVLVSAKTGQGFAKLRARITESAGLTSDTESLFLGRERHLVALRESSLALSRVIESPDVLELVAEELRKAHDSLGSITGAVTADDLLGQIFSKFCIGK